MKTILINKPGKYLVKLEHEGDEVEIIGRIKAQGKEIFDVNLTIVHEVPHTSARTHIRAVVDDEGMVNLRGKIVVKPGAQGTNSFLEERVLLLSPNAKAEAVPNLEIEANDVKCSHAAAISHIDDEQIFYLQSRGMTKADGKKLIADAFLLP